MDDIEAQGANIPVLGLGTWMMEGETCAAAVRIGLELGYRHLDTASLYGNEEDVGDGMRDSGVGRQEIFLATKVWHEHLEPKRLVKSVDDSLRKLRTDYVDLMYIHWPSPDHPWEPALDRLFDLRREGKIRNVGVSNFPSVMFREASKRGPVVCNQVEYHVYLGQRAVIRAARESGAAVVAYSPLARGKVRHDDTLKEIGHDHGKTPSQVALRWLVQQPGVGAIPKASSREHLAENLEVLDFQLSNEEMATIDKLDQDMRLIDPPHGPDWDPPEALARA